MTTVCAWHDRNFGFEKVIRGSMKPGDPVSHGICEECADRWRREAAVPAPDDLCRCGDTLDSHQGSGGECSYCAGCDVFDPMEAGR